MTDRAVDDVAIPALLRAARGSYSRAIAEQVAAAGFDDLPRNGAFVLGGMANRGGSAADMIRGLGVSKQTASQLIDALVLRGYLTREINPEDRRRMLIGLTERGRAAAAAVRAGVEAIDVELAEMISTTELAGLRAGLMALAGIAATQAAIHRRRSGAGSVSDDEDPLTVADASPVPKQVPLTTLLSWVWIAHTIEVDNAFEAASSERAGRAFRISLPMWTNGLRFIDGDGIPVDELRARARAACNIGGLERWGWISVGEVRGSRRDGYGSHRGVTGHTVLRPTRAGVYARRLWPRALGDVEDRWRTRFGGEVIDALRQALHTAATAMPWSPPETHPANGFFTHLVGGGDAHDPELPLAALLGQVLTALTLDHEQQSEVSLPLGANLLRVVGSGVVRLRDLPALTGISKEGMAMATGYLRRNGLSTAGPERTVRLTTKGINALDSYRHQAARAKDTRLRTALDAVVAQPGALSAGLVPPEGCWRGDKPYVAQTKRLLADPTGALPWHPMVLHRGGWPDAS